MLRSVADLLDRRRLLAALLLLPTLAWFLAASLGPLAVLLERSLHGIDDFTGQVTDPYTLENYRSLFTSAAHRDIVLRTVAMALLVTAACAPLGSPYAYVLARRATGRWKAALYLCVMLPLWSSYLVRVHGWRVILAKEGALGWLLRQAGLEGALERLLALPAVGGATLASSKLGSFLILVYMWLPYMILPTQAALERVPRSCLEAAEDLGARPLQVFRTVILPLSLPGVVAGSIFMFSLTLGDYIIPGVVGAPGSLIGQMVYVQQGTAGNIPLAAAFAFVPVVVMGIYLAVARRLGAFDAL